MNKTLHLNCATLTYHSTSVVVMVSQMN